MSRDFDNIMNEINKQHKELHDIDNKISKDIISLDKELVIFKKELTNIKNEVKDISTKIDLILEILNNFTLMVLEEEEMEDTEDMNDYLNEFDSDQTWVPNEDENWENEDD